MFGGGEEGKRDEGEEDEEIHLGCGGCSFRYMYGWRVGLEVWGIVDVLGRSTQGYALSRKDRLDFDLRAPSYYFYSLRGLSR